MKRTFQPFVLEAQTVPHGFRARMATKMVLHVVVLKAASSDRF